MSVEQKVKQIIVEQLGVDEAQVDPTASFVDDLGADSLDIVELVMAFEEAFDLDIPDEDAENTPGRCPFCRSDDDGGVLGDRVQIHIATNAALHIPIDHAYTTSHDKSPSA